MYTHILIPTDGSELAGKAVQHGVALTKQIGAKVHENSGDGNRFGNRVLNHTLFRQSGVCLRRARLN
jgi:nucleotide-binding universal stress UspA family protein